MLEEFKERIENAKEKQFLLMERFHIGDTVYPFWLKNFIVYGTVIDIDTVARKIICDFNGVRRQFCPEDLMLVNPALMCSSSNKSKKASKEETQLSPDTDNGINAICKECKGEVAVSYNEKEGKTDFVCTECGKRIPENKLSEKTKKAMREAALKVADVKIDDVKKLEKLLKDTFKRVDEGMHCWCQLPSGNYFTTEDEEINEEAGLLCYINERVDALGYPAGKMLVDLGSITDENDCKSIAEYAFECDAEFTDDDNDKLASELMEIAKLLIKGE